MQPWKKRRRIIHEEHEEKEKNVFSLRSLCLCGNLSRSLTKKAFHLIMQGLLEFEIS
jgi:hypothetical protein